MKRFTETMLDQRAYDQIQLTLKERDIELEHRNNMLASVNAKLGSYTDLQNDVQLKTQMMRESEDAREGLQETIVNISKQVKEDTDLKEKYQTSLLEEIEGKKREIERLNQQMSAQK